MRKLFTLLTLTLPLFVLGQDYTFGFGADTVVFASPGGNLALVDGKVKNLTTEVRNFTWTLDSVNAPADWDVYICDKNICYTPNTLTEQFYLDPSEEAIFKINVIVGTAAIGKVYVTMVLDQDTTQTISHEVEINALLSKVDPLLQAGLSMGQNVPNPFTAMTRIPLDLKGKSGEIRLTDLSGRELQVISVAGQSQEVELNADLPAGLYFYTLWVEGRPLVSHKMQVQ